MKHHKSVVTFATAFGIALLTSSVAEACTRLIYEGGDGRFLTARTLDWEEDMHSDLWAFPQGMQRDGGVGPNSVKWISKYGSVVLSGYDVGTADGMNEKGLVVNMLYLAESDFGGLDGKPALSVGAWPQYILDNFATVAEAVEGLQSEPFRIVGAVLPNGAKTTLHVAISDPTGDSAILEYIEGKLVIHHGREYPVMTNSPIFDKQITLNTYWNQIGGTAMLPGTSRASDRLCAPVIM